MFPFSHTRSVASLASPVTLNPSDAGPGLTFSNNNLTVYLPSSNSSGARATRSIASSDAYFEFTAVPGSGAVDAGFIPASKSLTSGYFGDDAASIAVEMDTSGTVYTLYSGSVTNLGNFKNQIIGLLYRNSNKTIYVYNNGTLIASQSSSINANLYPAIKLYNNDRATVNFGSSAFANPLPSGAVAINNVP